MFFLFPVAMLDLAKETLDGFAHLLLLTPYYSDRVHYFV